MKRLRELEERLAAIQKSDGRIGKRVRYIVTYLFSMLCTLSTIQVAEIKEINDMLAQCKSADKEAKELAKTIAVNEEHINESVREERFVREQVAKATDRLMRLQSQFEKKRCEADLTLKEVEAERAAMMDQIGQQRKQAHENAMETDERRREINAVAAAHRESMESLRQKYDQLASQVACYHQRLLDVMGDATHVHTTTRDE